MPGGGTDAGGGEGGTVGGDTASVGTLDVRECMFWPFCFWNFF